MTKTTLNWRQVKEAATYLSTALVKSYGLKEGDTVALFSQNTIWYPITMHAVLRVGGRISGASPAYNAEEMAYALKVANAKFLMTHPDSMEVATAAAQQAGLEKSKLFLLEGSMAGLKTVQDLIELGKQEAEQEPYYKIPAGKTNYDICKCLQTPIFISNDRQAASFPSAQAQRDYLKL